MHPAELAAPASWRTLEFISDVHLNPDELATAEVWASFLSDTRADALFILGDLFEVWTGDDLLDSDNAQARFAKNCIQALRGLSGRCALFFMHGNRDFLAGNALMQACGAQLLADPTVLDLGNERVLLSHGDALCLDDERYLQFREEVRGLAWQQAFLARPLSERQALAQQLRAQSRQEQAQRQASGQGYADVDAAAAYEALAQAQARLLLHGHTHRPGGHDLTGGLRREVLSDWDAQASPPRAQVLRLLRQPGTAMRLERQDLL